MVELVELHSECCGTLVDGHVEGYKYIISQSKAKMRILKLYSASVHLHAFHKDVISPLQNGISTTYPKTFIQRPNLIQ